MADEQLLTDEQLKYVTTLFDGWAYLQDSYSRDKSASNMIISSLETFYKDMGLVAKAYHYDPKKSQQERLAY